MSAPFRKGPAERAAGALPHGMALSLEEWLQDSGQVVRARLRLFAVTPQALVPLMLELPLRLPEGGPEGRALVLFPLSQPASAGFLLRRQLTESTGKVGWKPARAEEEEESE